MSTPRMSTSGTAVEPLLVEEADDRVVLRLNRPEVRKSGRGFYDW